jgi:peptidyl-prolyl cis-trans isomerase C
MSLHIKWNCLLCCLILAGAAFGVPAGLKADDTDGEQSTPVARVNGDVISKGEYTRQFSIAQQQLLRQGMPLDEAGLKRLSGEVLENMIDNELLYAESKKRGYAADEAEVTMQYDEVQAQFQSEQDFMAALKGMDYTASSFKSAVERRITLEKLIDNDIAPGVTVSEESSRTYYEENPEYFVQPKQVRASHILILADSSSSEEEKKEALQTIELVQQKLRDGGDFADLAREYSEGPSNTQGGDLGFFQRGQMVPPFEKAAFAMEVDEVSGVVETRFGYHLIKVTGIQEEIAVPYEYAKSGIDQYLKQNLILSEVDALIAVLKDKADITRYPENM